MSIDIRPKITPENLEIILKTIPQEPTHVLVYLVNFDTSNISKQMQGINPNLAIRNYGGFTAALENSSKENILSVYKEQYQRDQKLKNKELKKENLKKTIDLHEILWVLPSSRVHLTPYEINAKYSGQEPGLGLQGVINFGYGIPIKLEREI